MSEGVNLLAPKGRVALVIACTSILVIAACNSATDDPHHTVANRIRDRSPEVVREVIYEPQTFIDAPQVYVYLRPGAGREDVRDLWCNVIVPAGGTHDLAGTAVTVWNDAGTELLSEGITC
jgi:hypothetical protein